MDVSEFLTALAIIIMIDLVLGGDNAIVIALASRNLPKEQQNKAILFGAGLAIVIRVILTIFAVWLLSVPLLMLIGALFLLWIGIRLLIEKNAQTVDPTKQKSIIAKHTLSAAIKTIVAADIVMGLDNVLAVAGASKGNIWLIILGLLISIPIIIWGSKFILLMLKKYPLIIYAGAGVIAFTSGKMITHEPYLADIMVQEAYLTWIIPIFTILFVVTVGYVLNHRRNSYDQGHRAHRH